MAPPVTFGQTKAISPLEADRRSRALPRDTRVGSPTSGVTKTFELTPPSRDGAAKSYTLTIENFPEGALTEGQLARLLALITRLNVYIHPPVTTIRFEEGTISVTGYRLGDHMITVSTAALPPTDFDYLLGLLTHELGHALARTNNPLYTHPRFLALNALLRYRNVGEMVDDSNYLHSADNDGHPGDFARGEDLGGSGVHAYLRADQLAAYVHHPDTPEIMRLYGQALYLFLRDEVFHGEEFVDGAGVLTGAMPEVDLLLRRMGQLLQPDLLAIARREQVELLSEDAEAIRALGTYLPDHRALTTLTDRLLAVLQQGTAQQRTYARDGLTALYITKGEGLLDANPPDTVQRAVVLERLAGIVNDNTVAGEARSDTLFLLRELDPAGAMALARDLLAHPDRLSPELLHQIHYMAGEGRELAPRVTACAVWMLEGFAQTRTLNTRLIPLLECVDLGHGPQALRDQVVAISEQIIAQIEQLLAGSPDADTRDAGDVLHAIGMKVQALRPRIGALAARYGGRLGMAIYRIRDWH